MCTCKKADGSAAPVFKRVAQAVFEYLHTPHDIELPPSRQILLAERKVQGQDLVEESPDRLGQSLDAQALNAADTTLPDNVPAQVAAAPSSHEGTRENSQSLVAAPYVNMTRHRNPGDLPRRSPLPRQRRLPQHVCLQAARLCWTSSREALWFRHLSARACAPPSRWPSRAVWISDAVGSGWRWGRIRRRDRTSRLEQR